MEGRFPFPYSSSVRRPPLDRRTYWTTNLKYVGALLAVWFTVSYVCGILLVDVLNQVRIPGTGFKLGFWFAQQGAIYAFVILTFVYVRLMNGLDNRFEDSVDGEPGTTR